MFGSRLGFSGTADLMALFLPTTCTANLLCLWKQHHSTSLLMRKTFGARFRMGKYLGYAAGNKIAAFNLDSLRIANNARLSTCLVGAY